MRERSTRVYGPTAHRQGWRVELREGSARRYHSFATREQAERFARAARREAAKDRTTVAEAIDRYIDDMKQRELKRATRQTTRFRLEAILEPVADERPDDLTKRRAAMLYRRAATELGWSTDTHQNALRQAKTFWRFLRQERLARGEPWTSVKPIGRRRRGKDQLRVDEARALVALCVSRIATDDAALPALLCLMLGLRASEVMSLGSRDVDDGGKLVWIENAKTETGNRRVEVPEALGRPLRRRAMAAEGGPLWPGRGRHWLYRHVKRLCREAGVREVGPHALRGLHATLARGAGATGHAVAATLGHASPQITRDHYQAPDRGEGGPRAGRRGARLGDDRIENRLPT